MKLRTLIADFREIPATMLIGTAWVVVFLAMVLIQYANGHLHSPQELVLSIKDGAHEFGDVTLTELRQGEVWRLLTSSFVHYGVLHIGLNLWMFYLLGGEVESWYGPWQFVAIYVLIGGGGNLLSALMRSALHLNPNVHSGGGSVVGLGLIALMAVVGWRSRTQFGDYVRRQMVRALIVTAVIGLVVPIIDNWGHLGGALMGAAIGFAHRPLLRNAQRPIARVMGTLAILLLVASAIAQIQDDRAERAHRARLLASAQRFVTTVVTRERLAELGVFYSLASQRAVFEREKFVPKAIRHAKPKTPPTRYFRMPPLFDASNEAFRAALKAQLDWFDAVKDDLGTGPTAPDYQRVRTLLAQVFKHPPNDREAREFGTHLAALSRRAEQNQKDAKTRLEALARQL